MADIREHYVKPLIESGKIDSSMRVRLDGTAAQLDEVRSALLGATTETEDGDTGIGRVRLAGFVLMGLGVVTAGVVCVLGVARRNPALFYGALGCVMIGGVLGGMLLAFGTQPTLLTARFVWALLVTYLLICALFESFVYPFVIMFTVPLALVGGFAGLSIVHEYTLGNPLVATQNLDVLTMLGFVILVGVVVNNAILIVHQSLNLMSGKADIDPRDTRFKLGDKLDPIRAVSEAVATRTRPVFMSTMTSVGGMLPLVLFPGAGSELYRGLGSVVIGGLLVSTVFTLLLVPLVFSLTMQMVHGVKQVFSSNEIDIGETVGGREIDVEAVFGGSASGVGGRLAR
jgi:HAE1 family hydrophobic/amphiphilic exporter-1